MLHRHLTTTEWTPMAVESLLDRGVLADWQEFARDLRRDPSLARTALRMAEHHEDRGSAALVRILVDRLFPNLIKD